MFLSITRPLAIERAKRSFSGRAERGSTGHSPVSIEGMQLADRSQIKVDEMVDEIILAHEKSPEKPGFVVPPRGVEPLFSG